MIYPYHFAKNGVFFEAMSDGAVAIIRKAESRLPSRTLARIDLTAEQWSEAISEVKRMHAEVKGDRVVAGIEVKGSPSMFGPVSKQGSEPDTLPDAPPPPPDEDELEDK